MECKFCGRTVPENSIFCNWCGEKLLKERKKKDEIKVPTPKKLPSGSWRIYLDAEKQSITEKTKDLCISKAKAIRAGFIESKKSLPKITCRQAISKMMEEKKGIVSPSTIREYGTVQRNAFKEYMDCDLSKPIDWQMAISRETSIVAPKTVCNRWTVVSTAMRFAGVDPPNVQLPKFKKGGQPYLDYEQIPLFIKAIKGKPCELPALLGLHSLLRSEIIDLDRSDIIISPSGKISYIRVSGATVYDENNQLVHKETNKTQTSTRSVPIIIPRLLEIIPKDRTKLVTCNPNTIWSQINRVCQENDLPKVGVHGLRRSFASLAYHLGWTEQRTMEIGGWDDVNIVHDYYIQESQKERDIHSMEMERFYEGIYNVDAE